MKVHTRRRAAVLAVVALGAGTVLGACGDDDKDDAKASDQTTTTVAGDDATTTTAGGDVDEAKMCDAYTGITMAFGSGPEGDPAEWFTKTIQPLADELEANKAPAIEDELTTMLAAVDKAGTSGDMSAFESPEFVAAQGTVDPYVFENCEFDHKVEVTAKEYEFEGLPKEMEAGRVAILLTNDGAEEHEIAVARRKDGVTEGWDALLELPEDQVDAKVEFKGHGWVPRTGDQSLLVADFTAGDYLAVCFVPTGSTMDDSGEHQGDGPPHMVNGMRQEFTVA